MRPIKKTTSAFEQGQQAGKRIDDLPVENPFPDGSVENNNFEIGRRFGAEHSRSSARAPAMKAGDAET